MLNFVPYLDLFANLCLDKMLPGNKSDCPVWKCVWYETAYCMVCIRWFLKMENMATVAKFSTLCVDSFPTNKTDNTLIMKI